MKKLLKNGTIITMNKEMPLLTTDLVVGGGKILDIAEDIESDVDSDTEIIDCTGRFIMPSLFDSHAHLNTNEMAALFIANGITAIRSLCGSPIQLCLHRQVKEGHCIGPYIYSSGPIIDGVNATDRFPSHIYTATVQETITAVEDTAKAGYLWVKTYPSLTREQLRALMDTSNSLGIKVCGHMSYNVSAKELCDWGYHCCEHSSSLPSDLEEIEYLAKSGMWFCPTQVVCETLPDYVWDGKRLDSIPNYEYVPKPLRQFWEKQNLHIADGYKKRGIKPDINKVINRGRAFMEHSNRYMAGSDTMYPGIIAGFSLHDELSRLVTHYKRTPFEALYAATVAPALYMGLENKKGTIAKGMDSDLLILEKNPLTNIENSRTIWAVMQGERFFNRNDLDTLLTSVSQMKDNDFEFLAPIF